MTVLVTGSTGAVGSYVLIRLKELGYQTSIHNLRSYDKPEPAVHVMHLAGINRGTAEELRDGNAGLAQKLIEGLEGQDIVTLTYANSVKANTANTPYAEGKRLASWILMDWCRKNDVIYRDAYLPNLIGLYGKPHHNMIATTIVDCLLTGEPMPPLNDEPFRIAPTSYAADELCRFYKKPEEIKTFWTSALDLLQRAERMLAGHRPDSVIDTILLEMTRSR